MENHTFEVQSKKLKTSEIIALDAGAVYVKNSSSEGD